MDAAKTAELRREARRRRILENSDNRLRRIKGEAVSETSNLADQPNGGSTFDSCLVEPPLPTPSATSLLCTAPSKSEVSAPALSPQLKPPSIWQTEPEDESSVLAPDQVETSLLCRFCQARLHIILLAVLVRILLHWDLGFLFGELALVPLILLQITRLLLPGEATAASTGGLMGAALVLSGLSNSRVHSLLQALCIAKELAADLALYIFAFLIAHATLGL